MTEVACDAQSQTAADTVVIRQLLNQPDVLTQPISRHYTKPYVCFFYNHCFSGVERLTIYDVPRQSKAFILVMAMLSVLVPSLSYKLLAVQNGTEAQVAWKGMVGEGKTAVRQQMIQQLRDYCHLDTLAMVEIHHVLVQL